MIDMGYNLDKLKEIAKSRGKEAITKAKERKAKRLIWNNMTEEEKSDFFYNLSHKK